MFVLGIRFKILLFCLLLANIPVLADWEKVGEKSGIVVFRQNIPGSNLVAFRGEGVVDAPLLRVASVMFDETRAKEWIQDLAETKILSWYSPTEFLEYDHVKTPFILTDRDFLSKVKIDYDHEKKKVSFIYQNADSTDAPENYRNTKYVRAALNGTLFYLTSLENDTKTLVEGEVYGDPKGFVPKWIVNMFQKDWPTITLLNLRRQVAKPDIQIHPKMVELMQSQNKP